MEASKMLHSMSLLNLNSTMKLDVKNLNKQCNKILNLFLEDIHVDCMEFIEVLTFAINFFSELVKSKEKINEETRSKLLKYLKEYEDLITDLSIKKKLEIYLCATRLRRKVELLNLKIYKEISSLIDGVEGFRMKTFHNPIIWTNSETEKFWITNFGHKLYVPWNTFVAALQKECILEYMAELQLHYTLDNSNIGYVFLHKWNGFMNAFGPKVSGCVSKMHLLFNEDWFCGFLTGPEVEKLLERKPSGTYIARFTKTKYYQFAFGYVDAQHEVIQIQVICENGVYYLNETGLNAKSKGYEYLRLVAFAHSKFLLSPFRSELARSKMFHGMIGSTEAEEILADEQKGTFLFRFSSKEGFIAVSYRDEKEVIHCLLEKLEPRGYFHGTTKCPTLDTIIHNFRDLQIPLCNLIFDPNQLSLIKPPQSVTSQESSKNLNRTPTVMGLQRSISSCQPGDYEYKKNTLSNVNSDNSNTQMKWKSSVPTLMNHKKNQTGFQSSVTDPYSQMPPPPGNVPSKTKNDRGQNDHGVHPPITKSPNQAFDSPNIDYSETTNTSSTFVASPRVSDYNELPLPPPKKPSDSSNSPEIVPLNKPPHDYSTIPSFPNSNQKSNTPQQKPTPPSQVNPNQTQPSNLNNQQSNPTPQVNTNQQKSTTAPLPNANQQQSNITQQKPTPQPQDNPNQTQQSLSPVKQRLNQPSNINQKPQGSVQIPQRPNRPLPPNPAQVLSNQNQPNPNQQQPNLQTIKQQDSSSSPSLNKTTSGDYIEIPVTAHQNKPSDGYSRIPVFHKTDEQINKS